MNSVIKDQLDKLLVPYTQDGSLIHINKVTYIPHAMLEKGNYYKIRLQFPITNDIIELNRGIQPKYFDYLVEVLNIDNDLFTVAGVPTMNGLVIQEDFYYKLNKQSFIVLSKE